MIFRLQYTLACLGPSYHKNFAILSIAPCGGSALGKEGTNCTPTFAQKVSRYEKEGARKQSEFKHTSIIAASTIVV